MEKVVRAAEKTDGHGKMEENMLEAAKDQMGKGSPSSISQSHHRTVSMNAYSCIKKNAPSNSRVKSI